MSSVPPDVLDPGACVTIVGLVAKPALNGRQARVLSWVGEKERYAVRLVHDSEQKGVTIRPANVVREPGLLSMLTEQDAQLSVLKRVDIDAAALEFSEEDDEDEEDCSEVAKMGVGQRAASLYGNFFMAYRCITR